MTSSTNAYTTTQFVEEIADWKKAQEAAGASANSVVAVKKLALSDEKTKEVWASAVALLKSPFCKKVTFQGFIPVSVLQRSTELHPDSKWECDLDLEGDKEWGIHLSKRIADLGFVVTNVLYADFTTLKEK